jgi:MFS family permease
VSLAPWRSQSAQQPSELGFEELQLSLPMGGMAIGVVTSLLLPLVEDERALIAIYGLAGLGVAAFTPSALSLVGDAAAPGRIGHAYAWYSTAHYGAIGVGPFLGGLVAEWFGYRAAFVVSAVGIAIASAVSRPRTMVQGQVRRGSTAGRRPDCARTSMNARALAVILRASWWIT